MGVSVRGGNRKKLQDDAGLMSGSSVATMFSLPKESDMGSRFAIWLVETEIHFFRIVTLYRIIGGKLVAKVLGGFSNKINKSRLLGVLWLDLF